MALPILDGNQSATTLSSILTSGEHIPAHTVVSLGTQAITNIATAVSGSVVSISNLPATQPVSIASVTIGSLPAIAGTVTANLPKGVTPFDPLYSYIVDPVNDQPYASDYPFPISGTVTVGNSVTIGSLPLIAGTVTANVTTESLFNALENYALNYNESLPVAIKDVPNGIALPTDLVDSSSNSRFVNGALPISGTVTAMAGTNFSDEISEGILNFQDNEGGFDIGSLPAISGTVTANTFALQGTAVTTSNFTSTTASTLLAGFNAGREVLTIFNEGAGNLHVCAGATCTTIAYQVRLSAGDYYEVPNHQTTITHSAVFATAGTARVTQVS